MKRVGRYRNSFSFPSLTMSGDWGFIRSSTYRGMTLGNAQIYQP